jgi:hypothetical protein
MWSLTIITIQDESRLMKRKEQNRAAQRAFRERKEKHVKDVSLNLATRKFRLDVKPLPSLRIKLPSSKPRI